MVSSGMYYFELQIYEITLTANMKKILLSSSKESRNFKFTLLEAPFLEFLMKVSNNYCILKVFHSLQIQASRAHQAEGMTAYFCNEPHSNDWTNVLLSDGCFAMGGGTTEKISVCQVGIEPTTSVTLVGCSHH